MQATLQPTFVKTTGPATQAKIAQPRFAAKAAPQQKSTPRFLDYLRIALSGSAV